MDKLQDPGRVPDWLKRTGVRESGVYYQAFPYRGHLYWRLSGMIYLEEEDFRRGAEILKGLCDRVAEGEHVKGGWQGPVVAWETSSEESALDTPRTGEYLGVGWMDE